MPQIVTGKDHILFHCEWDNLNRIQLDHYTNVNNAGGMMVTNMLPIVHVTDKNKLLWSGNTMRREEESMLMVEMQLKMKEKRPRVDQY